MKLQRSEHQQGHKCNLTSGALARALTAASLLALFDQRFACMTSASRSFAISFASTGPAPNCNQV